MSRKADYAAPMSGKICWALWFQTPSALGADLGVQINSRPACLHEKRLVIAANLNLFFVPSSSPIRICMSPFFFPPPSPPPPDSVIRSSGVFVLTLGSIRLLILPSFPFFFSMSEGRFGLRKLFPAQYASSRQACATLLSGEVAFSW